MKKPVQHAPKRVDMKLISPFSGICSGMFPRRPQAEANRRSCNRIAKTGERKIGRVPQPHHCPASS